MTSPIDIPAAPPKRIVLIDDEAGVVLALRLLLQSMGFDVEALSDPQKALDYICQGSSGAALNHVDLVLCDLRMPVKNGFEVLTEIKQFAPNLPCIIMSGHAEDAEQKKALALGAKAFLSKPFGPDELRRVMA